MIKIIETMLSRYLTDNKDWKYTHCKSIGEIEMRSPWIEEVYTHKSGYYIVHHQNLKHIPIMSCPTPRHTWRLQKSGEDWKVMFQYGVAE